MRFSVAAIALASAVVGACAENFVVTVGANNQLAFTPNTLSNVSNGDTVSFQFQSKNHSVTQSTFAAPCTASGIDSGFQFTQPNATSFATWTFTVENASAPIWFYCAQTNPANHCQAGMVFAINPTAEKNFTTFQNAAMATNTSSSNGQNPSGSAISGTAGATDGALSVSGFASTTATSTGGASSPSATHNGAAQLGGNVVALFTLVGLALGSVL